MRTKWNFMFEVDDAKFDETPHCIEFDIDFKHNHNQLITYEFKCWKIDLLISGYRNKAEIKKL